MSDTRGRRRFGLTLKIFGASALVVVLVLGGTLALATVQASHNADAALDRRLLTTREVVGRLIAGENAKLASGAHAAMQNPAYIAEFHTGGSAFLDLATTFRGVLGADYVLITDNQAVLKARTDAPGAAGTPYDPPVVVHAIDEGRQGAFFVNQDDQRLFLAVATPLKELPSGVVLGVVVATHQVTDSLAGEVKLASGSQIVFYVLDSLNQPVVAASTVPNTPALRRVLAAAVAADTGTGRQARVAATIGNEHLVGIPSILQNPGSLHPLGGYLALQSRDVELAGFRRTQRTLLLAGLVGLVIALGLALLVARVIGRPVRDLVGVARRVAEGDYDARVEASSHDEIGDLASAIQRMVEELKA